MMRQRYEARTVKLVRELYSADDEAKIVREYLAQLEGAQEEFNTYNNDILACKERAWQEVYRDVRG